MYTTVVSIASQWIFTTRFRDYVVYVRQYVPGSEKETILCTANYNKKSSRWKLPLREAVKKYIVYKRVERAISSFRSMKDLLHTRGSFPSRKESGSAQMPYIVLRPGVLYTNWHWPNANGEGCKKRLVQIALVDATSFPSDESARSNLSWSGPFCVDGLGEFSLYAKDPRRSEFPHLVHIDISKV
jgi:hypothetical protein